MTVGFYAPLPPAHTGVADYSAALLKGLRQFGRVETNPRSCEIALYHLGNNRQHAAFYHRALEQPGIVVLHDAILHHFLLGELDRPRYIEEFVYNYGAWNRSLAEELWRGRGTGGERRYFQYPMVRRIAERARAVIVHNPAAARIVTEHAPKTPVIEISHLFAPPELPGSAEVARFREQLGFSKDVFVFGVLGYLRESKRLMQVCEAFIAARRENPWVALLVAGNFVSADLERAFHICLAGAGLIRLPYLSRRDFWLAAAAVDGCINLRYPGAGETSGITIRLMGIGKPVMLTDSLENTRFPEDCCLRIPSGLAERDSLRRHMLLLPSSEGLSEVIGRRAADFIQTQHSLEQVARLYWDTLCAYRS